MTRRLTPAVLAILALTPGSFPACASAGPGAPEIQTVRVEQAPGFDGSSITGGGLTPAVRVTRGGTPVSGVAVRFTPVAGEGDVPDPVVQTGIDGRASTLWLLGFQPGEQTLRAEVEGESVEFAAIAAAPQPGSTHLAHDGYAEYVAGELPIVIAAPHGGTLDPTGIPDRSYGTTVQDLNTEDLARRIADELHQITGSRPHLVISHLHRRKLDPNREIVEAAQGNPAAERAWHEYHAFIETARAQLNRSGAGGFFLDVHGHGHEIQRLELGYLLSAADLGLTDAELDQPRFREKSSIRHLAGHSSLSFSQLLRGERSLGSLLDRHGYPAVPAAGDPGPAGAPYFSGGYSTARHGSRDGGTVDAVQLEANRIGIRDTAANRQRFAEAMAAALLEYLELHAPYASPAGAAASAY